MKSLITGITGFVGSHLAELLLKEGHTVYGTIRWRSRTENIEHIRDKLNLVQADMKDAHSMVEAVKEVRPDYIFHLAAQSFVPTSWNAPAETLHTNIIGTVNLLEAVREAKIEPVIVVAGSSEEYGYVEEKDLPITEETPLKPLSPYGVSKVGQDRLSYQYFKSYGMKIVVTRAFNHTGPRRGEVFVTSNFAKQIAEIEAEKKEPVIYTGNLEAKRDFTDVRDVVRAYLLAAEKCLPGEAYNICTGRAYAVQDVLNMLLNLVNIKIEIKQDPARLRPSDVPILLGDCSKFKRQTGWQPAISFEQTLKDLLDYWRGRMHEAQG